jgi:hypothetical protein
MYKVIVNAVGRKEAISFPDKPKAMNCAVRLLKSEGDDVKVTIEDATGIVFNHAEIARASEAVRL